MQCGRQYSSRVHVLIVGFFGADEAYGRGITLLLDEVLEKAILQLGGNEIADRFHAEQHQSGVVEIRTDPGRNTTKAPASLEPRSLTSRVMDAARLGLAATGKRTKITPGLSACPTNASQPKSLSSVSRMRPSVKASFI